MAMYILRRAALRALTSSPQLARPQSTLANSTLKQITSLSSTSYKSAFSTSLRRTYASEERDLEEEAKNAASSATESVRDTASRADERAQSTMEKVAQSATEAAERVQSAFSSGIDAVTPDTYKNAGPRRGREREDFGKPSTSLYIGNLYFEVTEASLRKEFSKYGNPSTVKIVYDGRGLSKGFGYVEYTDQSSASAARDALDGQVFEGRRLAVQYALKAGERSQRRGSGAGASEGYNNAPSKTLFIGNMSYEMSDKDLNDLFRGIKNVLDVRVAIDRRTGQPRGFAHADFLDVKSADEAAAYLKSKEFYGRALRIDYSASPSKDKAGESRGMDN